MAVFGAMESLGLLASPSAKASGDGSFPDEGDLSTLRRMGKRSLFWEPDSRECLPPMN